MTLEELKDFNEHINALRKHAEALIAEYNQPQAPKLERWKPEIHQTHFYLGTDGKVLSEPYITSDVQFARQGFFNIFPSAKEAKQEALRTRARRKLEWLARQLHTDTDIRGYIYVIDLAVMKVVTMDAMYATIGGIIYFDTHSLAEYALSRMAAEELQALT